MAADFIDGLVKTISQTTKELGKATKELSERAEQTIEAQKIRNRIAGEEKIIEKIKVDIGNWIYKKHADGEGLDSELSVLCQEIDQHYLKIREFRDSVANIKGQKVCPSCEREVDMSVSFCPYCGTPCPTPEPAENVEGEAVPTASEAENETGSETENKAESKSGNGTEDAAVSESENAECVVGENAEGSSEPEETETDEPKAESTESVEQEPLEEQTVEESEEVDNKVQE